MDVLDRPDVSRGVKDERLRIDVMYGEERGIFQTVRQRSLLESGFLKLPPKQTLFSWWLVAMWLATGGWVAGG